MLLNNKQIQKIMKKAAVKVEEKFKKIEEEEALKKKEHIHHLITIRETIKTIERKHPNRGRCCCIWGGTVYHVDTKTNRTVPTMLPPENTKRVLECVVSHPDKKYYMFTEASYKEQKDTMDWMEAHYAEIKIAVHHANKGNPSEVMSNTLYLGSIFEDFQQKFPDKSILDFLQLVKVIDTLLQEQLRKDWAM